MITFNKIEFVKSIWVVKMLLFVIFLTFCDILGDVIAGNNNS